MGLREAEMEGFWGGGIADGEENNCISRNLTVGGNKIETLCERSSPNVGRPML